MYAWISNSRVSEIVTMTTASIVPSDSIATGQHVSYMFTIVSDTANLLYGHFVTNVVCVLMKACV